MSVPWTTRRASSSSVNASRRMSATRLQRPMYPDVAYWFCMPRIRGNIAEVCGASAATGNVITDQAPARPNPLDRVGDGSTDDAAQRLGDAPHRLGIYGEECLRRNGLHGLNDGRECCPTVSGT